MVDIGESRKETTAETSRLAVYDDWHNSRIALSLCTTTCDPIHAVALSADGRFLAIGNDGGNVEVRHTGPGLGRLRDFMTGAAIRSLLWHPSNPQALFIGCGNGNVYLLEFDFQGKNPVSDVVVCGRVNGFVHAIAFNEPMKQLAVGYGHKVVLFDKPFVESGRLGVEKLLDTPKVHKGANVRYIPFARGIHFLDSGTVLVTFFGRVGIIAYSTLNGEVLWGLPLSFLSSTVSSSSLSPSRRLLAVMNTRTGVDWYSTTHRRFLMSTRYDVENIRQARNLIVHLDFMDDITVAVGNVNGKLIFAQLGMSSLPPQLSVASMTQAVQTVCCGYIDGISSIVAVLPVDDNDGSKGEVGQQRLTVVHIREPTKLVKGDQARFSAANSRSSSADASCQTDSISQGSKVWNLMMGAYIAIWPSGHILTTTAYAILALIIAMELYCRVRTNLITPASTTTSFLSNIESVKTTVLTETITAIVTPTKTKEVALDHLTPSSTCVCILTGTWNTPTVTAV